MEYAVLNNGVKMPLEGFGVFQVPDPQECEQSVYTAIKAGYRLIDTAAAYFNEPAVGKAVARALADGLTTRGELFITTKVWVQDMQTEESALAANTAKPRRRWRCAGTCSGAFQFCPNRCTRSGSGKIWTFGISR